MLSLKFWKDALERAIKTAAQSAVVVVGTGSVLSDINWVIVASGAALGFILSILTSIGSSAFGSEDSASLIK